jgi:hypothetical protein
MWFRRAGSCRLPPAACRLPPAGSVLRHRFELMHQEEGLPSPNNVIESAALLLISRMLQRTNLIAMLATDAVRCDDYASHDIVAVLPPATLPHERLRHHHPDRLAAFTGREDHGECAGSGKPQAPPSTAAARPELNGPRPAVPSNATGQHRGMPA